MRLLPLLLVALVGVSGCLNAPAENTVADLDDAVWTVDLIRTLPGQQAEYLRNIENNWAGGRRIGRARGHILAYHALVAPPDSALGWDVLLLTAYADSTAWANREAIFDSIFASPEYVPVPMSRPSGEVRAFVASPEGMRTLLSIP